MSEQQGWQETVLPIGMLAIHYESETNKTEADALLAVAHAQAERSYAAGAASRDAIIRQLRAVVEAVQWELDDDAGTAFCLWCHRGTNPTTPAAHPKHAPDCPRQAALAASAEWAEAPLDAKATP